MENGPVVRGDDLDHQRDAGRREPVLSVEHDEQEVVERESTRGARQGDRTDPNGGLVEYTADLVLHGDSWPIMLMPAGFEDALDLVGVDE